MIRNCVLGLFIIFLFHGCAKKAESTFSCSVGNYDPCSFKAPASEIQAVKDYLSANNITATVMLLAER
jgi:FKBP-type peptidyl-prolyl cis-trans isomerase FkpA